MLDVKLIAFDLDGTAITAHRDLSPANRDALEECASRGIVLMPATGRMLGFLPPLVAGLSNMPYVITCNGAGIYRQSDGQAVFRRLIPNEKARQVQAVLEHCDIYIEYYRDGQAVTKTGWPEIAVSHFDFPRYKLHFVTQKRYQLADDLGRYLADSGLCPEKINLPYVPEALRSPLWQELEALGGLRLTSSIPDNIEINAADAHKGAALRYAAEELLGIPLAQVMAFGDNGNDLSMLETAGESVAMADGAGSALAAAKHIAPPHDQDGLARFLRERVLG